MTVIEQENCNIMYSENFPYIRIDMSGLVPAPQLAEKLSSPRLFALLQETHVTNVLLNLSQSWRVGTEDLEWLETTWLKLLSDAGVRKVSVVTARQVYDMLVNIFQGIEAGVNTTGIEIHFFDDSQFYEGWESVSWF